MIKKKKKKDNKFSWSDYADMVYGLIFPTYWSNHDDIIEKDKHKVPDNIKSEVINHKWKDKNE